MDFIPVNTPLLDGNEKKYVAECIETAWISSEGPFVKRFEEEFAHAVERDFAIAVANGTAAIDIAVEALGIGEGDEVIVPGFTIISCVNQIVRAGAIPVLVDSDPLTWNMDVSQIEEKITSKTRAIMIVHIYGLPADIEPILRLAEKYALYVIEDAAEMHGQTYRGKNCGSFGDISTFSFYPNKHITTGEGGMIVTNKPELAEKCRMLRNLCFQAGKRFVHEDLGWNYRMTNLQAALGLAQLESLPAHVDRKREIGRKYHSLLKDCEYIQLPQRQTDYSTNIYWVFGIVLRLEFPHNAEYVMKKLQEANIGTRPFFYPMNIQPVFLKKGWYRDVRLPIAENLSERGFYVPSGLGVTDEQILYIAESLKRIIRESI